MSSKSEAKALPCIFNSLSKEYHDSQLMQCETKEDQRWRHASATAAVLKLTEMANTKYFLHYLYSLENYSLCERHYNNIIARKYFIEQLTK